MKNDMIESIMDSYMRRGLLRIVFSASIDTPERRVNLIDMKAVFVVPCRIAEDKKSGNQAKKPFGTQRNLSMTCGRRKRGRYGQRVLLPMFEKLMQGRGLNRPRLFLCLNILSVENNCSIIKALQG